MKRFLLTVVCFFCSEITKVSGEGNTPEGRTNLQGDLAELEEPYPHIAVFKGWLQRALSLPLTGSHLEKMRDNVHKFLLGGSSCHQGIILHSKNQPLE